MMRLWTSGLFSIFAACAGSSPRAITQAPPTVASDVVPISDPAEYQIDAPSRAAGERIFLRTGIGDPYRTGIPYPVFLALLEAYPEQLGSDPQAFAKRFGFVERDADPASADADVRAGLPVGMHLTEDPLTGVAMVVTNCTLCHAQRVRAANQETLVIGLGNKRVRIHEYDAALSMLGKRADLTTERLNAVAAQRARDVHATWPMQYASAFTAASVRALRDRAATREEFLTRLADGPPGLVATIESFALAMSFVLGHDVPTGDRVGWAKIPDIVGYPVRSTLSWDAAGVGSKDALVVEADFAAGARLEWFWAHPLQGPSLTAYLNDLRRDLHFPGSIDDNLAGKGRALFEVKCSKCHGSYAEGGRGTRYDETVVAAGLLGTDDARSEAVTEAYVEAANDPRMTHGLVQVRRTQGYVPPVLTDLWVRAPFGHAGQWPSLTVLAELPERRPKRFVVDLSGTVDLENVGVPMRAEGAPLRDGESLYDAQKPGLSVGGHPFLAQLLEPDRRAVIEYLKSL